MTWSDDFNRADGAVGNSWVALIGNPQISGNAVSCGSIGCMYNPNATRENTHDATILAINDFNQRPFASPIVKCNPAATEWYYVVVTYVTDHYHYQIMRHDAGGDTELDTGDRNVAGYTSATHHLVWSAGHLTFYVDGDLIAEADDNTYADNVYMGFFANHAFAKVDDFTCATGIERSMIIRPDPIYNGAGTILLTATGTNTEWSAGPPASTTFTVNHGTIHGQQVLGATSAIIYFSPDGYLGQWEFTESQYGLTYIVTNTTDPDYMAGGDQLLTVPAALLLALTANYCPDGRILTTCEPVDQEGTVNIPTALDAILEQLGGYPGQVGPDIGAVSTPAAILELFERPVINPYWTAEDMVGSLGGSPTVYSNADLMTALGNLPAATYQPVLDALVALQGDDPPTLAQLGTMISDLSTISGYTLQDVRDWIDAIPTVDLSGIESKLDAIQPSTDYNLSTLTTKANTIGVDVGAVLTALGLLTTDGAISLATIIDAIAALSDLVQSQQTIVAPVWPSLDQVTLGAPVAFDGNVDVTADMDGVLVNLTHSPTKTGHYILGNIDLWYGLGRISFESDNGDIEPWQYLAFDNGLFAPKTMQHAAAVHLQVLGGAEGTVTPWTITPPAPAPAVATAEYDYPTDDDDPAGC